MAKTSSYKQQCNADNTEARLSYWAWKILLVSGYYLNVGDSDKHEKDKIKLVANDKKKLVIISVYCIL